MGMPNVTNPSNTVGFVDLDEMYDDEIVTTVSLDLLEDAVAAAKAIESGAAYQEVQVHLVDAQKDIENLGIAFSTSHSRPMAAMVAPRVGVGGSNDDA